MRYHLLVFVLIVLVAGTFAARMVFATLSIDSTSISSDGSLNSISTGNFDFTPNTSNADVFRLTPAAGGAGTFVGTFTSSDLTANRTWTFPNGSGTLLTSGSGVNASDISPGTFQAGDYIFQNGLTFAGDGVVSDTMPAAGYKFVMLQPTLPGNGNGEFAIRNSFGRAFHARFGNGYTMLFGTSEADVLYFTAPEFVLFSAAAHKVHFHTSYYSPDQFVLGSDGNSEIGSSRDRQYLQAFDGYRIPGVINQHSGHLVLSGGRPTGTGTPGKLYLSTADPGVVSGQDIASITDKVEVSDGLRFIPTGLAKPTCNVSSRFKVWPIAGGAGVADTFEVCMKDAGDVYAWRVIAP